MWIVRLALRRPYTFVVMAILILVMGVISILRTPTDIFPNINIPVVVVATFYSGMPPEQIEYDITGQFERMFTLASGVNHMESRSLVGIGLIKIYFRPEVDVNAAISQIISLAIAVCVTPLPEPMII